MNPEMAMVVRRNEEREALRSVIQQWNANRLDLFELSEPNENLEFHGVMRFYFQDSGQKVATKCIRVASDATAQDVVETLIEKFRPDMRMLSLPEYALFEIHENGEERKLAMDEKPLLVQLNWHKDDREGRFLLRRLDDKTNMPSSTFQQDGSSFRRKLSKREKKQLKKQEKLNRLKSAGSTDENDARVAEKLYTELPETSFTRSISNPEAVMRRRRQQQERKLQQFRSKNGGPDTGGTLKIYGESLCRDVPYKTLLLSIRDTAQQVVREMLIKYGLDKDDPHNYCLIQVNSCNEYSKENNHQNINNNNNNNSNNNNNNTLNNQEYILDDDECPLAILMNHPQSQGSIMFHVRRRPADYHPRKRKKKPQQKWNQHQSSSNELLEYRYEDGLDRLPLFLELNPDGSEICGGAAKRHRLHPNVTEVGCERNSSQTQSQYLQLFGPNILPRHCVIANTEGIVTVTPCSRDSETYVNGQRIYETTILRHGSIVKFGRIHCFRFLDPYFEERIRQRQDSHRNIHEYTTYDRQAKKDELSNQITACAETRRNSAAQNTDSQISHNFETTFDVEGNIETRSTSSQGNKEDSRSQRSIGSGSKEGNRISNLSYQRQGTDAILPAVLEIKEETEETLLNEIITSLDPNTPSFKLAPAYCLYLMARYRASTHYRPELTPTERAHRLTLMLARVASIIQKVIQERYCDIKSLALWLANSSELLFFLQFDRHLFAFSKDARRMLAESVQISFRHLVGCVQSELSTVMPLFFVDKDDASHDSEESPTILGVLGSAMTLLRRYRVNVALTVQLFSHLFHFINVWAFNRLIAPNTNYCSRLWGLRLKARLVQIEVWAEKQGLEISTDTHLAKIVQAAHLLQAPKYSADDLASLSSTCFLLNSLQLRALLMKYQSASDEPPLPREHIENVVKIAENLADELARSDGREVKLEEDPEFALEFVLPIDSYSCEVVRGIPPGLVEFVNPLQNMGLCRLSTQPTSNGLWTVYMELPNVKGAMMRSPSAMSNRSVGYLPGAQEPEIQIIKLHKSNNGMGLSIVAAKGAGQDKLGIYIKSVVKGGAADLDGRLLAGDQLLKVDGQSLVGITQEKAAEYLVRTGPIVTLEVAKQGAIYHGLATLLSQPSPVMNRARKSRPHSELFKEPFRDFVVPTSSISMINLNQNTFYSEYGVRWNDKLTGVTNNIESDFAFGGGSIGGKHLKVPHNKHNFQPRYGNFLHPDYALLYPNNVYHEGLYDSENKDDNKGGEDKESTTSAPVRGILTTGNSSATTCPYTSISSTDNKLCLDEDVMQRQCKNDQIEWKIVENRDLYLENDSQREPTTSTVSSEPAVKQSITKRIVSDVKSCCLGVTPESDTSVYNEETSNSNDSNIQPVSTNKKSILTGEALPATNRNCYFLPNSNVLLKMDSEFRNSCPLMPSANELCECEKRIFSSDATVINDESVVGKVVYDNRNCNALKENNTTTYVQRLDEVVIKNDRSLLKDVIAFNEQYRKENLKGIIFGRNIINNVLKNKNLDSSKTKTTTSTENQLTLLSMPVKNLLTRRTRSDVGLNQMNSMMAECTKCGNRFNVSGTYFSEPVFKNVDSSESSSLSETSSSLSSSTSTSSSESKNESRTDISDKNRKLTKEEREVILKELEDIVSGDFFSNLSSFSKGAQLARNTNDLTETSPTFSSSLFHLDLKALKDSDTSISDCSSASVQCSVVSDTIGNPHYCRQGRVAELTRHFSKLGEAGIIRSRPLKTKSVPNISEYTFAADVTEFGGNEAQKSASTEALVSTVSTSTSTDEQDVAPNHLNVERIEKDTSNDSTSSSNVTCSKRRQSFARQNTVFCKMKSVDELDARKRPSKSRMYKYASLADFRLWIEVENDEINTDHRKKGVSVDDLNMKRTRSENREDLLVTKIPIEQKKFSLETVPLSEWMRKENFKINYRKMKIAVRNYLANKELLLKQMKSNSDEDSCFMPRFIGGKKSHFEICMEKQRWKEENVTFEVCPMGRLFPKFSILREQRRKDNKYSTTRMYLPEENGFRYRPPARLSHPPIFDSYFDNDNFSYYNDKNLMPMPDKNNIIVNLFVARMRKWPLFTDEYYREAAISPLGSTTFDDTNERDNFVFKDNIRRVYKGPYLKGRRVHKSRKLIYRRNVVLIPNEHYSKIKSSVNEDLKRIQMFQSRCQSLDTAIEQSCGLSRMEGNVEQSHKL